MKTFLCVICLPLVLGFVISTAERETLRPNADLPAYWASFQVLRGGGNPYDTGLIQRTIDAHTNQKFSAKPVWNPPILYLIFAPLFLLPLKTLLFLWPALNLLCLSISGWIWWRLASVSTARNLFLLGAASLVFAPCWMALRIGQISNLFLLCFSAAVLAFSSKRFVLSGALFALFSVKPHVIWLVWPFLAVEVLKNRKAGLLYGGTGVLALVCAATYFIFPEGFSNWLHSRPVPGHFLTATLATPLRLSIQYFTGEYPIWPALALAAAACLAVIYYRLRDQGEGDEIRWMAALAALSIPLAPYGYYSDYAIVQPLQVFAVARWAGDRLRQLRIFCVFLIFELGVILGINEGIFTADHEMIFFPGILFLMWLWALSARSANNT